MHVTFRADLASRRRESDTIKHLGTKEKGAKRASNRCNVGHTAGVSAEFFFRKI